MKSYVISSSSKPLLAHSWRDFLKVKAINLPAGNLAGGALMMAGW